MSLDDLPFDECAVCHSIVLLRDEVVGKHPVTGRTMRMHDKCAKPEHYAIPIRQWLHYQVALTRVENLTKIVRFLHPDPEPDPGTLAMARRDLGDHASRLFCEVIATGDNDGDVR